MGPADHPRIRGGAVRPRRAGWSEPTGGEVVQELFRLAPLPYLVLSERGIVLDVNEAAASFLGRGVEQLRGWPMLRFVAPADRRNYLDFLYHGTRKASHLQAMSLMVDQKLVLVRMSCVPTRDGSGRNVLLTAITDLRPQQAAEDALRLVNETIEQRVAYRNFELARANHALREKIEQCGRLELELRYRMETLHDADRAKDEFIAMLAHELRNPLAPIRNAVEVLKLHESDDEEVRWARDLIDRQLDHLRRLVDDLLDVSRVSRGTLALRREPVDVSQAVDRALEISQPGLAARAHQLEVHRAPERLLVDGDPDRLAQALSNLLNNAVKYTDPGGRIVVETYRAGTDACIAVCDTGRGIEPELLPRIFEPFTQGSRDLDRAEGGLGLGLALVKRIVDLHEGRIEATSGGPGLGARFEMRFPLIAAPVETAGAAPAHAANAGAHRHVLIVDDNVDALESLRMLLEFEGHDVRTARDGEAALRVVDEFDPDVLLLDIGLPGMSGRDLARRLRERPQTRNAVMVAISGYGTASDIDLSRRAGFDDHLVKPVDGATLDAVLARADTG